MKERLASIDHQTKYRIKIIMALTYVKGNFELTIDNVKDYVEYLTDGFENIEKMFKDLLDAKNFILSLNEQELDELYQILYEENQGFFEDLKDTYNYQKYVISQVNLKK